LEEGIRHSQVSGVQCVLSIERQLIWRRSIVASSGLSPTLPEYAVCPACSASRLDAPAVIGPNEQPASRGGALSVWRLTA
jgi:hypothetical protein